MRAYDTESVERRRTLLRTILFLIILGTLPCYLLGFWLWGTAPDRNVVTETPRPTNTPLGADITPTATIPTSTPFPSNTPFSQLPLQPTPFQFTPPTRILTDTPVPVIPTSTPAPTLTPLAPTNTPLPAEPPTQEPPPVFTNPPPILLPPTDTPNP